MRSVGPDVHASPAAAPDPRTRPARPRRHVLGDVRVTVVPDGHVELDVERLLVGADAAAEPWAPYALDGRYVVASIGALLVETPHGTYLVDAGIGSVSLGRRQTSPLLGSLVGGDLVANLERLGYAPADIDAVVLTHPHDDHMGWVRTDGPAARPQPFRHAVHHVGAPDAAVWARHLGPAGQPGSARVALLDDGDRVAPGLRARVAPGHTPGHLCLEIESRGERLVVLGDLMHTAAQVGSPATRCTLDDDADLAASTRASVLDRLAHDGDLAYAGHFADVVLGRVVGDGRARRWEPLPACPA
ncbi:MBL fold metallo-hydrolase [Cellulomonas sp. NPDC055163]